VSAKHYDDSEAELHSMLFERATAYVSVDDIVESHVKKWRFATPRRTFNSPCWTHPTLPLVLAGDAFDGPRIEGAALSGLAAASIFS
jgi:predicted NAD/FAD-dependent oxidoreductase